MSHSSQQLRDILERTHRIAVIGMKPAGAAFSVPAYMQRHGYEIVAVNPNYHTIGSHAAVGSVAEVDGPVDMVNIFRRSDAVAGHVDEILAMDPLPKTVWMQLGIRNDAAAERLQAAGIDVVQDRCLKVEYARSGL